MQNTFEELSQMWCETKCSLVKHSTMCAYRLILKTHLLPYFGLMREIGEDEVQRFIIGKIKSGLAKKTVRDIVAVLKAIVKYGARHQLCAGETWILEYPSEESRNRLPVLSLKHQKKLMAHILKCPNSKNIGVLLALCTGMRIGEVCALQWIDIDLTRRLLQVRQTVGRIYNCDLKSTERIFSTPKTKHSFREIPISRQLYTALCAIKPKDASSLFVVGNRLKATEPRSYRDYFSRLLNRLAIPRVVFHGLRHTFATRCIESQCDYKTVSAILGHSNVATTLNLYVHPNMEQKKRCIDRMSKLIGAE